jgi:hypothetical protein
MSVKATIIDVACALRSPKGGKSSMRTVRLAAAAAVFAAVVATPGIAEAATISQPFHADSGDACHYGVTDGTLGWHFGATSPLPVGGVDVTGKLTDHPTPSDPVSTCRDDGYYSIATFVAYAGSAAVDSQTRTADNATVSFSFTLGGNSTTTSISRIVIQVCRGPVHTLPPTYCGRAVTYTPPPVA